MNILRWMFVVISILVLQIPNAEAASYQATDIAAFDSGTRVTVSGVNSSGIIAGTIAQSNGKQQAFTWSATAGFHYLNALQGFEESVATGINDEGQVVGYSAYSGYSFRASLWGEGSTAQDLGALLSGEYSSGSKAFGINKYGQIVGASTCSHGYEHAVLWTTYLEDISGTNDLVNASANAVNNDGTVVGQRWGHAFIWNRETGMSEINVSGLLNTTAVDINNLGQVIGQPYSTTAGGQSFVWQEGYGVNFIGTLPYTSANSYSLADDINNVGQVVGMSNDQAFIWDNVNGIQSLPLLSGHLRGAANSINDSGLIAGYSIDNMGRAHLVLWTPVPEPSSLFALLCGLGGIGGLSLRRRKA